MVIFRPPADPVAALIVASAGAGAPLSQRQHQSAVREPFADAEGVDRAHCIDAKPAGAALISKRAVEKAVGQNPIALEERGPDQLVDMVRAGRGEQQSFRLRSPAFLVAGQQQLADLLRSLAATWLASFDHLDATLAKRRGKGAQLGALTGALPAFEADETPPVQPRPFQPAA